MIRLVFLAVLTVDAKHPENLVQADHRQRKMCARIEGPRAAFLAIHEFEDAVHELRQLDAVLTLDIGDDGQYALATSGPGAQRTAVARDEPSNQTEHVRNPGFRLMRRLQCPRDVGDDPRELLDVCPVMSHDGHRLCSAVIHAGGPLLCDR